MTDLFITATWWSAVIVLSAAIGYAVGRGRERAAHETRIVPVLPEPDALDRLLVDGGSLAAARRERQMRVVK